jgi:hypothetical protein
MGTSRMDESGSDVSWYGVRCIFKWRDRPQYEERVTVWRSTSFEAAIERAEAEANQYAAASDFEYLGLAQGFDLKADQIEDGSEVFSLIRTSPMAPDEYINRFFDTGSERQDTVGSERPGP